MKHTVRKLITVLLVVAMALSLMSAAFATTTATANEDSIRVRQSASDDSEPVTSLRKGDTVVVKTQADENGWVEISYTDSTGNTGSGFVHEDQITAVDVSSTPIASVTQEEHKANAVSTKVAPTALVVEAGVRIREKGNTDASVLATLSEGDVVTVLAEENADGWMQVSYQDAANGTVTGFVSAEYLEVNAIGSGKVNTRTLIIREQADETSAIVGIVQEGDAVQIYAVSDGWYKIECGQYTGYVDGGCITGDATASCIGYGTVTGDNLALRATASADGEKLTSIPSGVTFQITSDATEGWYGAIFNGMSGYVSAEYVQVSDSVESGYVQVTADSLSLRAGAGTQYARLGTIPCGTLLTVQGTVGDWYVVSYNGTVGYANGAYVSATTQDGYKAYPDRVKISTDRLALRTGASADSDLVTRLDEGTVVAVSDMANGWYKVTYGSKTGYIKATYAEETTESVTPVSSGSSSSSSGSSSSGSSSSGSSSSSSRSGSSSSSSSSSRGSSSSSSGSSSSSSSSKSGSAVASYAQRFLGNPYKWGGTSLTNGCDCSGFVLSVYAHFGVSLPHSSASMRGVGYGVSTSDMQPGDIVCYSGHVGIYVGGGQIIAARSPGKGIGYTNVYYKTILAVRRIF